jgi:hypothetical protein
MAIVGRALALISGVLGTTPLLAVATLLAANAVLLATVLTFAAAQTGPVDDAAPAAALVARASRYVASFVPKAAVLLARESYVQRTAIRVGAPTSVPERARTLPASRRTLESEVALVQVMADRLWLVARDVLIVDGKPVPDSKRVPLASVHPATLDEALKAFRKIARQGARFNIGSIRRDLNVPTIALWFLSEGVHERFDFTLEGADEIDGADCQVLGYVERSTPYLLQAEGRDAPVRGRFWIAPATGAVLRTELILVAPGMELRDSHGFNFARVNASDGRAIITVDYAFSHAVQAWVPREMRERYDHLGRNPDVVSGTASYRDYKRFTVETKLTIPR